MRRAWLVAALWLASACTDEDAKRPEPEPPSVTDSGVTPPSDAGTKADAAKPARKLEEPGALARPPKAGLPADLRPPR